LGVLRLAFAGAVPLAGDEAYYWQWSRHLAWGYYDQGPLIAFLIRFGTWLLGPTETGVRLTAVLLSSGASILIYVFCARIFFDETLGLALVLFFNSALIFNLGGIIQTYDTPQIFFWLLCVWMTAEAVFRGNSWGWYGAGAAAGLSLLAKYSSGMLPLMILAFLLFSSKHRHWLARPQPYVCALIALAVFSPNLWWNWRHDFVAFSHTAAHAGGEFKFTTPEFIGGQAAMLGPIAFVILLVGLVSAWRQARRGDDRQSLLLWTSLPLLLFFLFVSFKARAYGNWTAPGYLSAGLAAGLALKPRFQASKAWRRWGAAALITGYLLVAATFLHAPVIRWIDPPTDVDPTTEVYGWPEMGRAVGRALEEFDGRDPFLFSLRYQIASLAAFYTPGQPEVVCLFLPGERLNAYLMWQDPADLAGRDAVGAAYYPGHDELDRLFDRLEPARLLELVNAAGRPAHYIQLFDGYDFQGYDFRPEGFGGGRGR
jgi:undecaprenyl-diphosphatase